MLRPVAKTAIEERLEPKTRRYFDNFQMCDPCGQIYWPGSHFEALAQLIDEVVSDGSGRRSEL
jgi:uncharacterized protein